MIVGIMLVQVFATENTLIFIESHRNE
jgi:hypothetical protein